MIIIKIYGDGNCIVRCLKKKHEMTQEANHSD